MESVVFLMRSSGSMAVRTRALAVTSARSSGTTACLRRAVVFLPLQPEAGALHVFCAIGSSATANSVPSTRTVNVMLRLRGYGAWFNHACHGLDHHLVEVMAITKRGRRSADEESRA